MVSKCRFCGCNDLKRLELNYVQCSKCKALMLNYDPDIDKTLEIIMNNKARFPDYDGYFEWRIFLSRIFLKEKSDVLEVSKGKSAISSAFSREGYNYSRRDVDQNIDSKECYDAVILWDLLETVANPKDIIAKSERALKTGGVIFIRAFDQGSLRNRRRRGTNLKRRMINYLTAESLVHLIQDAMSCTPILVQLEYLGEDFLICIAQKERPPLSNPLRVLLVSHPDAFSLLQDAVGPRLRIFKTILQLRERGVLADLSISPFPRCEGYDLVHLFHHAWKSRDNLQQALCAKFQDAPLVISTIFMDLSETNFALRAIPAIFSIPLEEEREGYLCALARGELQIGEFTQREGIPGEPDQRETQQTLFSLADHLIGLSLTEIRQIGMTLGVHKPFTIVPNCADPQIFENACPKKFIKEYGIKDFVISVGHVEARKNTLMLLYALRQSDFPVVIVGNYLNNQDYFRLCRYFAPENTLFIHQLSQEDLASAFAAAKVHALPSWAEGASLASIEAAMAGCNVIVSNRTGEWEYFREEGFYCDPASLESIRKAVEMAYTLGNQERRQKLRERALAEFTFQRAAERTVLAYERTLEAVSHGR